MRDKPQIKVGLVLPETYYGEEEWKNAEEAQRYADEAAHNHVDMLCFPEGYPGPSTGPFNTVKLRYDPIKALCNKAKEHGILIVASNLEKNPNMPGTYFLTLKLISRQGTVLANYRRMQPDTPPLNAYLYNGRAHILPGEEFIVEDTDLGRIGLEICSELFVPELSRILMLRGAEIIVAPIGGIHSERASSISDTWRCVARARAAENLCYVLVTHNLFRVEGFDYKRHTRVGAFAAGPEKMIAASEDPGLLLATLDMERLDGLRARNYDEQTLSRPKDPSETIGCRLGQIYERMPELYHELTLPHDYSFDYMYFKRGLDKWEEDYDRIYKGKYQAIRKRYGKLRFR